MQAAERSKLAASNDRLNAPYAVQDDHDLDAMKAEIVAASVGTIFEAHFAQPDVQEHIVQVLGSHFASSQHIERSWHADRNPTTDQAKAFKAQWHGTAA